jgi:hypothetical protein
MFGSFSPFLYYMNYLLLFCFKHVISFIFVTQQHVPMGFTVVSTSGNEQNMPGSLTRLAKYTCTYQRMLTAKAMSWFITHVTLSNSSDT